MEQNQLGILTLAFGSEEYIQNAKSLARSVRLNSSGLPIAIITDRSAAELGNLFDIVVPLDPSAGATLMHKLLLDRYTPFKQTVFLDSDCLVVRRVDEVARYFIDDAFGVVGENHYDGEWFGADISTLRLSAKIEGPLPRFNSGLIFWRSSELASSVFQAARDTWLDYQSLGLGAFRKNLAQADEPLLSIGMARCGVLATRDPDTLMNTPIGLRGRLRIDTIRGECHFRKYDRQVSPLAPHFCGYFRKGPVYRREAFMLRLIGEKGWDRQRARTFARTIFVPAVLTDHSVVWDTLRGLKRAIKK